MLITISSNVPDSTYFRTDEAEPVMMQDGSLVIYNGHGTSRGWGRPGVTSTVVVDADDFAAIHVGFFHKHGGGQFWRYYMTDGESVMQVEWRQLPDDLRTKVLAGATRNAPSWAKVPGKLREEYKKPSLKTRRAYKLVQVVDGRLCSIFDASIEYRIGIRMAERAQEDHGGGFYSHPSVQQVLNLWNQGSLVPERCYGHPMTLALIEVEIAGTIIDYPNGKMASTYLTPVAILETFEYAPTAEAA